MTAERKHAMAPRAKAALAELQGIITEHYPAASFAVRRPLYSCPVSIARPTAMIMPRIVMPTRTMA